MGHDLSDVDGDPQAAQAAAQAQEAEAKGDEEGRQGHGADPGQASYSEEGPPLHSPACTQGQARFPMSLIRKAAPWVAVLGALLVGLLIARW